MWDRRTHWWPPTSSHICSASKHSVRSAFYPWKCAVFEGGKSHRIVLAVAALNPTSHRIGVRAKLSPKGCRQTVENRMKKSKGMVRWGERWGLSNQTEGTQALKTQASSWNRWKRRRDKLMWLLRLPFSLYRAYHLKRLQSVFTVWYKNLWTLCKERPLLWGLMHIYWNIFQ